MYSLLTEISNILSQPFLNVANSTETFPLISAFALGLVGAVAPCQISGNISAITMYGNNAIQKKINWLEIMLFILGKMVVFSGLGLIVWLLGNEIKPILVQIFPWIRKVMGPVMFIVGLFMLGLIKTKWKGIQVNLFSNKKGLGAFLMGVAFALAFCPTMFVLFFVSLMPLVLSSSIGAMLPSLFAVGTSFPLLLFIIFIWFFGFDGTLLKKSRRMGVFIQKLAGLFMIIFGILDTLTYW